MKAAIQGASIGLVCIALASLGIFGKFFVPNLHAQEPDRAKAALPALVEQRNAALDAAALCQGDIVILKQQIATMQAEMDKLKAEPSKK